MSTVRRSTDKSRSAPPGAEVTGLLLCGGKSRRMGEDKAVIELDGRRLIDRAAAALGSVAQRVVLASGAAKRFPELGLECVLDESADAGPLAGLAAGLAAAHTRFVAVLACDMPHAGSEVLDALLARAQHAGLDGAVFQTAGGAEPLCAVYSTACLGAVRDALERGERRMNSFWTGRDGLRQLQVKTFTTAELALAVDAERQAQNLNTPQELAQERARARKNDRRSA